jgi:heme-degrading monooxygenase HmoA
MSVLVTMRVQGDTSQFRDFLESGAERMRATRETAQAGGCLHHRFGVGDGFVLVMDEWDSAESFQAFFEGNPELATLMRDAGAQSAPEITIAEAVSSPDEF